MTSTPLVLRLADEVSLEAGGGKAASLARLVAGGFPVPPGFVVTTAAYRAFLIHNDLEGRTRDLAKTARVSDPASLDAASAAIRSAFSRGAVPPAVVAAVRDAHAALGAPPVAVRSSATTEDLPELSFAGQHDTFLHVVGSDRVLHAVVKCWSSLWTARAVAYRLRNGIPHDRAALAVVIQQMVASDVSGVLFTANPLTGRRREAVIDATFGLGEALVSGKVDPDQFIVDDEAGKVIARRAGSKAVAIRGEPGGGTVETAGDAIPRWTLSDAEAIELTRIGRRVSSMFGTPQDIEWARTAGGFHALQSRPITTLFPLPDESAREGIRVFLSIGAVQGMLDPFTPLGLDVFQKGISKTIAHLFGPPAAGHSPFVVAGERIFLDVTNIVRRPPMRRRMRLVLRAIEPMTGAALDEIEPLPAAPAWGRFRMPGPAVLRMLSRGVGNLAYNVAWPDSGRARVQRRVASALADFERRAAAARTIEERGALIEQIFLTLIPRLIPVLVPGVVTGLGALRLLHVLAAPLPDGERRALELTRGLPHNVTTEMDLALWQVARATRHAAAPEAAQAAVDEFLRAYGMRGVAEIDLGRPRWRDDPAPILRTVESYQRIDNPDMAPDLVFQRGAASAERGLESIVSDLRQARFGWLKTRATRFAARRMRALAGLRESPKFTVITMLGMVREGLLESGRELVAARLIEQPDDIFFLHLDELRSADVRSRDWREIVRARRHTYQREKLRRRVPRLLLSDGRALFGEGGGAAGGAGALTGTPVSPGVVEGPVRVVFDPGAVQLAPGEILVCPGTDPAWTPLFLTAGGLVTEVGGLMTHGSVVAREYGIPAVVGVYGATTKLVTGQRVRVDGSAGTVTYMGSSPLGP